MGLEPTTYGTTIRCSNLLSYIHHFEAAKLRKFLNLPNNNASISGVF
jgi:hypothetical protein